MTDKEPRIVCLMCNFAFCSSENPVPSNFNVGRVNCIGEIDPTVVLEIFEKGGCCDAGRMQTARLSLR